METTLIVLLALALIWKSVRLYMLRRGVRKLTGILNEGPIPSVVGDLPKEAQWECLKGLSRVVLDSIAEAELQRDSAVGRRKIQSVLLDQVNDALFVVDEDQEIRYANKACRSMFDQEKEPVGRQLIEVCLTHHFADLVELAMKTEGSVQDQVSPPGSSRILLLESGSVNPEYNIGKGAWLIVRDITVELHTEQVRKDFVANASHELRTPLTIIKGYLEMLGSDPKHSNAVNVMMKHTDRLTRIVEDMLLISRIERADEAELQNKKDFDVADCIYDMIEQLRPVIEAQEAEVKVSFPPDRADRTIHGDQFYWDQIFFNLIENALKQNPYPGLKIKVIVEKEEFTGRMRIMIIDDGVGIPATDLPEIFKRFYRVDKSHAQKVKGTGLGLSIVKRAVEAHNGTISVFSRPGDQTCFEISLPGQVVAKQQNLI